MAQRIQEEKDRILLFLAESLSFSKTLAAFPGLTVEELKDLILEGTSRGSSFGMPFGREALQPASLPSQQPTGNGTGHEGSLQNESLTIFIDGASRGNPGQAGVGVVIRNQEGAILKQVSHPIGETTNNVAEYRALLTALDCAIELGAEQLIIYSDSELLVNQMNGTYRVKAPGISVLWSQAREKLARFKGCQLIHISREANLEANALAQRAVKRSVKASFNEPP